MSMFFRLSHAWAVYSQDHLQTVNRILRNLCSTRQLISGLLALACLLSHGVVTADTGNIVIYRSVLPDGTVHFATQAHDRTYEVFMAPDSRQEAIRPPSADRLRLPSVDILKLLSGTARRHGVDPALIVALVQVESRFRSDAISPKGAFGLMQLMPLTAREYGVTAKSDDATQVDAGVRHLKQLLELHNGNTALALAAYNAGGGRVAQYGTRVPPFQETLLYVSKVTAYRHLIEQTLGVSP